MEYEFISHRMYGDQQLSIVIVESKGKAHIRLFQDYENCRRVYFEGLSVEEPHRKLKLGSEILKIAETAARILLAKEFFLSVEEDSWVHDWYRRIGYSYFSKHEEEGLIWMIKKLEETKEANHD